MLDIFKKIVSREIPSYIIWEDVNYLAFLDINPIQKGHVLVIPKKQYDYIFDIPDQDYIELMLASKKVASIIKDKIKCKRVCIVVEGYAVSHVHVHLIPTNSPEDLKIQHNTDIIAEDYMKEMSSIFSRIV